MLSNAQIYQSNPNVTQAQWNISIQSFMTHFKS